MHEVENLIEWELYPLSQEEKNAIYDMASLATEEATASMVRARGKQIAISELSYHRTPGKLEMAYGTIMAKRLGAHSKELREDDIFRIRWQKEEVYQFIALGLTIVPQLPGPFSFPVECQ
jgi:hypothetical protein